MEFNPQMIQAVLEAIGQARQQYPGGNLPTKDPNPPRGLADRPGMQKPMPPLNPQERTFGPLGGWDNDVSKRPQPMPMPQGNPVPGPNPDMQGRRPTPVGAPDPAVNAPNKFQPGGMTGSRDALRKMILASMQNRGLMTP